MKLTSKQKDYCGLIMREQCDHQEFLYVQDGSRCVDDRDKNFIHHCWHWMDVGHKPKSILNNGSGNGLHLKWSNKALPTAFISF